MPRNISFSLTTEQIRNKSKTVTRRLGWWALRPGTILQPVEKGMGLRRGEKARKIGGPIRVISVRKEPLNVITQDNVVLEGFPAMSPLAFIDFFKNHHRGCLAFTPVNRIEFEYV